MWVTIASQPFIPTPIPPTPFLSFPKLPQPPTKSVQLRRRNRYPAVVAATVSPHDIGGLGQAVFSTLESGPSAGSNPSKKVQQEEKSGKEISGSDILRALQKASAKKASTKKQQQKKKGSIELKREKNGKKVVDYDKVRPITVKSDWATRLDDLEKRLQEFSAL
ncbi:hypothetical protein SOVF_165630 [Spinacia oleracea]|uniref:Uncharacterized protein LOC110778452 n=1 Tax=Spinacia oleracea TaxID=3562 RepID=A0A9R0HXL1_SPIOL|nr:uncharacterized protein LOC110778452 [Spinacia oleracea]XP_056693699.1 uncharacterized protein LOC110778452 [Spinacia oleracea]KNA08108.1 hypothetical protein SOVF_165630 [Spinacia oleracea]